MFINVFYTIFILIVDTVASHKGQSDFVTSWMSTGGFLVWQFLNLDFITSWPNLAVSLPSAVPQAATQNLGNRPVWGEIASGSEHRLSHRSRVSRAGRSDPTTRPARGQKVEWSYAPIGSENLGSATAHTTAKPSRFASARRCRCGRGSRTGWGFVWFAGKKSRWSSPAHGRE